MMDSTFTSASFQKNASVAGIIPAREAHACDLIIIKQFHGGMDSAVPKLLLQPDFAELYLNHHNQIRALCAQLLQHKDSHLFVEGFGVDEQAVFTKEFAKKINDFESQHLINPQTVSENSYAIQTDIKQLLTEKEREYCLKHPFEFNLDDADELEAMWMATTGHFLNEYCERFIGSFRMAAQLIMNDRAHCVHGMEINAKQSREFPESSLHFTNADRMAFEKMRVHNFVRGFKDSVNKGIEGILVIGAAHSQIGTPCPVMPHIPLLEDIIPSELPDTRLIIVEPRIKVWDAVEWSNE